jgi:D-amino peptidase
VRVYVLADLEGATAVTGGWAETSPNGREFAHAKAMLTADVNACARGAFDGGATDVYVFDGHGMTLSIDPIGVDPRIRLLQGRAYGAAGFMPGFDRGFDAMVIVGMHAMEGTSDGIMNSSFWSPARFWINDIEVGETGMFAAIAGQAGVPVVLVTGDEAVSREARALIPGVHTVAVKKGLTRYSGEILPPQKAWDLIEAGARAAVGDVATIRPFDPGKAPEVRMRMDGNTQLIDALARLPGIERIDGLTIRSCLESIEDSLNLLTAFVTFKE